jgi:hypothetical protein
MAVEETEITPRDEAANAIDRATIRHSKAGVR